MKLVACHSLFLILLLASRAALAERDLSARQGGGYYAGHGVATALAVGGSVLLQLGASSQPRARLTGAWAIERGVQENYSPFSARVADVTLLAALSFPLVGILAEADQGSYAQNATLIYAQALSVSLLVNTAVKHAVRRRRPDGSRTSDEAEVASVDSVLSFYSGHATLAFCALTTGGLLYSQAEVDPGLRVGMWGVQAFLASLTGQLRVRAGRHYPTDVLVGAVMGVATGALVVGAHGVLVPPQPEDWASLAGGLGSGLLVGYLFPKRALERAREIPVEVTALPGADIGLSIRGSF